MSLDLEKIARELKLAPDRLSKAVQLLDDGNTIPFITRFRKDETGGLNEKQLLSVKQLVQKARSLEERRATILKSIESQSKLDETLKSHIEKADSLRQLEDLYLPFKPKKQTLAATARQQGLEPLAQEVLAGESGEGDLAARAANFVRVDKGLSSVDDVIAGVGHIIAEQFSDNRELRAEIRKIIWNTGHLTSFEIPKQKETPKPDEATESEEQTTQKEASSIQEEPTVGTATVATGDAQMKSGTAEVASDEQAETETASTEAAPTETASTEAASTETTTSAEAEASEDNSEPAADTSATSAPSADKQTGEPNSEASPTSAEAAAPETVAAETVASNDGATEAGAPDAAPKKKKKKKKKKSPPDPFKDYFEFKQPVKKLPHHRLLAINRGERAGRLNVKVESDDKQVGEKVRAILVNPDHKFEEFVSKCAFDAVEKYVLPSLEREVRRELTESAERHAVEVFASNLKNLLLQPPIHNRRVLAIDPGYKRGCTMVAVDETGKILETGQIFVVGNAQRREESAERIKTFIEKHNLHVITIGNGAACRETEQMVSSVLTERMPSTQVKYVILNEAGASTYSTSETGREELPELSANERSAVSIGRRLQDPLSELVKISPANIGVGMYQHDVRAKHLSDSLDEVVRFCVNRVGVNVNTASPSLLKYVSGLNQLTARRIVEYRQEKGAFKNRQQLKEVTGFGDATFVQAAGFLRIVDGDEPLDSTSIHPESYEIARKILTMIDASAEKLFCPPKATTPTVEEKQAEEASAEHSAPQTNVDKTDDGAVASDSQENPSESPEVSATEATASDVVASQESTNDTNVVAAENSEASTTTSEPAAEQVAVPNVAPNAAPNVASDAAADAAPPAAEKSPVDERPVRYRNPEREAIVEKLKALNIDELAKEFAVGRMLIRDIIKTFSQPSRDPRDGISKPVFRSGILKVDDLKADMQLDAQVVNVVDFGVFVDIGLGESSLIHVSQLSNRFIRNPHQYFAIGDVVKVWVTEIDSGQRRVKLTAIKPGTPKFEKSAARKPRGRKPDSKSSGNRGPHSGKRRGKPNFSKSERPRRQRPPKKAPPITKEMLDGKEPMRSFSDLLQFVEKSSEDGTKKTDES